MGENKKLLSIKVIEFIVNLYDFITLPLYYIIQRPWQVKQAATRVRARNVGDHTWMNVENRFVDDNRKPIGTLDQLFRDSVSTYATRDCLGVRKIHAVEYWDSNKGATNKANDQRTISKYVLDDKYTWHSYAQIGKIVEKLSGGLVSLCHESINNADGSRKLLICADTCMQWFLMAHACFRNNITVVTAYTTLDDEAILHSIQQTEIRILVVSQKFAPRIRAIAKQAPLVDTIIVLDDPLPGCEDETERLQALVGSPGGSNIKQVISYGQILERGAEVEESILSTPKADDVAVLMYTSGSTGKAKGVMLTHSNIVYTSLAFRGPEISHEDRYIGYLPLGHVLELAAECIFLRTGSTIAYSSPMTLTSYSPMIKRGQHGDAHIFKPTMMGAVPLVLDRIRNAIQQKIKSQGQFYDQLINDYVIRYKRYWWERYYDTPLMNKILCKKFNMILGGEMRAICSGGAALSRDTQEYLRFVTNYTVLQGYGLTETSAAASFCDLDERRSNLVGAPYPAVRIKLESWSDYSVNDKPQPRGEIVVGGQPVSLGYYKMDELTRESFYTKDGIRYFRTGDIGMILPDGCLKIIDRKKDIVKPLSGEYISLSQVENTLRTAPMVENILVYCSPYSNYLVALVKPQITEMRRQARVLFNESSESSRKFRELVWKARLAESLSCGDPISAQDKSTLNGHANGHANGGPLTNHDMKASQVSSKSLSADILEELRDEVLCSNLWLVEHVLRTLQQEGSKKGLKRTQIPSRIKLICDEWTPESGMVTASFKLRRREIERHYESDIKQLYAELGQKIDQGNQTLGD